MRTPKHKHKDIRKRSIKHKHKAVMVDALCLCLYFILVLTWRKCWNKHSISTRWAGRVRSSFAYAYVVGVLACFSADYAYTCSYALVKTSLNLSWTDRKLNQMTSCYGLKDVLLIHRNVKTQTKKSDYIWSECLVLWNINIWTKSRAHGCQIDCKLRTKISQSIDQIFSR